MTDLKLARLPDRTPARVTISVTPEQVAPLTPASPLSYWTRRVPAGGCSRPSRTASATMPCW